MARGHFFAIFRQIAIEKENSRLKRMSSESIFLCLHEVVVIIVVVVELRVIQIIRDTLGRVKRGRVSQRVTKHFPHFFEPCL
jgi:hypothetical protein